MDKTVAVIGASNDRSKYGNKALRAFREEGYRVVPINPDEAEVEGLASFPSVLAVPEPIDMATVYVPPEIGEKLLPQFRQKQIAEIWINPGAESDALLAEARRLDLHVVQACSIRGIGRRPSEF